jgi:hypothetical protein
VEVLRVGHNNPSNGAVFQPLIAFVDLIEAYRLGHEFVES